MVEGSGADQNSGLECNYSDGTPIIVRMMVTLELVPMTATPLHLMGTDVASLRATWVSTPNARDIATQLYKWVE